MGSFESSLATLCLVIVAAVTLAWAMRARKRSYREHLETVVETEVCEHLRPAYELLVSRGHKVVNAGQKAPDLPLEIHLSPRFDPKAVYDELKLADPVFLSERNVLFCKEDWCELHPKG